MAAVLCHGCGMAFDPPEGYARSKIQCPGCGVICVISPDAKRAVPSARKKPVAPAPVEDDWFVNDSATIEAEPTKADPVAPPSDSRGRGVDTPRSPTASSTSWGNPPVSPDPTIPRMELDDPSTDDNDDKTYELRERLGERCPRCSMEMEVGAVACVRCGYNRKTRKKAARRYDPIHREWESDRSLSSRLMWLGAAQCFHAFLGLLCYWTFETFMPAIISWFPLTAMLCFLLGTYDKIILTRDTRGRVRIIKQWRFAFVPREPITIEVRGYEGIVTGPWLESGMLEWFVLLSLLAWGVIPGLIWYWTTINTPQFMVALAQDHGHAVEYVYRGRNRDQMNDMADAVAAASGLTRLG
ncbi:MAG: hypothetical protein EBV06_03245 [Planctomycetia bacterium]|nr:hypothetical protein [Planctomycetia bacterium]